MEVASDGSQKLGELLRKRDFPGLIKQFDALLKEPNTASEAERTFLLINRSICYHQLGLYRKSLKDLDHALSIEPENSILLIYKAKILVSLKQSNDAKSILSTLLNSSKIAIPSLIEANDILAALDSGEIQTGTKLSLLAQYSSSQPYEHTVSKKTASPVGEDSLAEVDKQMKGANINAIEHNHHPSSTMPASVAADVETASTSASTLSKGNVSGVDSMHRLLALSDPSSAVGIAIELINNGKCKESLPLLDLILEKHSVHIAALAARGTARALVGDLKGAVDDFNQCIRIKPNESDFYKRRAQALAALNRNMMALEDLGKAQKLLLVLDPLSISDVVLDKARIYQKIRDYKKAENEIKGVLEYMNQHHKQPSKPILSLLASCQVSQGELDQGIETYKKLLEMSPNDKEAILSLGMALKEMCRVTEAHDVLDKAAQIGQGTSLEVTARRLLSQMAIGLGQPRQALHELSKALDGATTDSDKIEFYYLRGTCYHALGEHQSAIENYQKALAGQTPHIEGPAVSFLCLSFYLKEMALWARANIDTPVEMLCLDADFTPEFKELWCKKSPPSAAFVAHYRHIMQPQNPDYTAPRRSPAPSATDMNSLIQAADVLGVQVQYRHQGFLPNRRQHRMAGLAAIEYAQLLVALAQARRASIKGKGSNPIETGTVNNNNNPESLLFIPDAGASAYARGKSGIGGGGHGSPHSFHHVGWRDAMECIVKWRQIVEPAEQVVWVDLLTEKEFSNGFGSHTPMFTGQTKCVRYYMNFERALKKAQEVMAAEKKAFDAENKEIDLSSPDGKMEKVLNAKTAEELWNALGKDAWVVVPIESTTRKDHYLEGTRLTVVKLMDTPSSISTTENSNSNSNNIKSDTHQGHDDDDDMHPDTYEFSIRTPVTPARWVDYDEELAGIFDALILSLAENDKKRAAENALRFSYYWYNFMPLARGSALCGYVSIIGSFLAMGAPLRCLIPPSYQTDWEAILESSPEMFLRALEEWMMPPEIRGYGSDCEMEKPCADVGELPRVSDVLKTMRDRLDALNLF